MELADRRGYTKEPFCLEAAIGLDLVDMHEKDFTGKIGACQSKAEAL